MAETYTYEFGGNTYRTDRELSGQEMADMVESYKSAGLLDPETQERQKMSFQDVVANQGLLDSYRTFRKKWTGEEFEGNNEELAKDYYERMRHFDTNLGSIGQLSTQLLNNYYSEDERVALNQMWTAWDNINNAWEDGMMWDAVWDYGEAAVSDPFNWIGLFTGGAGFFATMGSKEMAKAGVRKLLVEGIKQGTKQGVVQGSVYGGAHSVARQNAQGEVGIGDGVDAVETLKDTAVGGVAGGTFGGVLGGVAGGTKGVTRNITAKAAANKAANPKTTADLQFDETGKLVVPEGLTEKEVLAGIHYLDVLGDSRITGEARQEARDKFVAALSGDKQARMRNYTESGVPVSNDERLARGLQLLERLGIKIDDTTNFDTVADDLFTKWNAGEVSAKNFADFNRIAVSLEDMAHERLRKAYTAKDGTKLMEAWASFEKAVTVANANAKQAGSALQIQSLRGRTDSLTFGAILKEVATRKNLTPKELGDGVTWLSKIAKKEAERNPGWKLTGKALDGLNEFWINNILGSPITIGVNVASSGIHMLERDLTRIGAAAMRGNSLEFRLAAAEAKAHWSEGHLALRYMLKAFAKGEAQLDKGRNFVDDMTPAIGDKNWDFTNPSSMKEDLSLAGGGRFFLNLAGNANRFLGSRAMVASDELVKQMAFRGNLYSSVMRTVIKENPTMTAAEINKLALDTYRNLTDDYLKQIALGVKPKDRRVIEALKEAREVTFQNDYHSDPAGWLGKKLGHAAVRVPLLRQVMPFIRTPSNLLSHSIQRTPGLNMTSKEMRRMLSSANPNERAKAQMILNISTTFWASAIAMASTGMLQGGTAGGDWTKKGTLEATGDYLPYSVELPDGSRVQIRRADPYAHFFMVMGSVADTFRYGTPEQQQNMFSILTLSTMEAMLSKTTLTGLADIFEVATDDSKPLEERMGKYGSEKLKTFMPYYRFVRDVFEDNPALYENIGLNKDNPLDIARAAYYMDNPDDPFDRRRSPIFGNEMTFLPSLEVGFFKVPGFPERSPNEDPVMQEIARLGMDVPLPNKSIDGINWQDIRIKPKGRRSAYDMYAEAVGLVKHPAYGNKTLYYALKDAIERPEYLQILTDNKMINLTNMPQQNTGTRQELLMGIINAYRGQARRYVKQQLGAEHELNRLTSQVLQLNIQNRTQQGSQLLAPLIQQ